MANKNKRLRWAKEHRNWTEELYLEGQHPGVTSLLLMLRMVFCVRVCVYQSVSVCVSE